MTAEDTLILVADAVATALTDAAYDGQLSEQFTAVRAYRPKRKLAEFADLRVTVVPRAEEEERESRGRSRRDLEVDIAVQRLVDAADPEAGDPYMALISEIRDLLRDLDGLPLADGGTAIWLRSSRDPVYVPEHLEEKGLFTGILRVTYRVSA